jgi:hypothetical protein
LIHDKVNWKETPKRVPETMANGKLGEVGGKFFEVGRVVE